LLLASLSAEGLLTVQRIEELLAHLSSDGRDAGTVQQLAAMVAPLLVLSDVSTTAASEALRAAA
jgi:hypothetical protein